MKSARPGNAKVRDPHAIRLAGCRDRIALPSTIRRRSWSPGLAALPAVLTCLVPVLAPAVPPVASPISTTAAGVAHAVAAITARGPLASGRGSGGAAATDGAGPRGQPRRREHRGPTQDREDRASRGTVGKERRRSRTLLEVHGTILHPRSLAPRLRVRTVVIMTSGARESKSPHRRRSACRSATDADTLPGRVGTALAGIADLRAVGGMERVGVPKDGLNAGTSKVTSAWRGPEPPLRAYIVTLAVDCYPGQVGRFRGPQRREPGTPARQMSVQQSPSPQTVGGSAVGETRQHLPSTQQARSGALGPEQHGVSGPHGPRSAQQLPS